MKCLENYSFPKDLRVRKKREFKNLFEKGCKFFTKNFVIFIVANGKKVPRLGITVTRKYGKAVKRNRLKRLLREFFRLNKALFKKGYDYLFVAKKECSINSLRELEKELVIFLKNEANFNF